MKAEILNAFLNATIHIVEQEIKSGVQRTGLKVDSSEHISDDVTVYVALVGKVRGMLLAGMSTATARSIASTMVGEPQPELNELGISALAEMGNLIAGKATMQLEKLGYESDITPPTLMIGRNSRISTLGLPRFIIPLKTDHGPLNIHVAVDVLPG